MMFRYPYLGTPYYNRYSRYGYRYPNYNGKYNNTSMHSKQSIKKQEKSTYTANSFCKNSQNNTTCVNINANDYHTDTSNDKPLFNLFGIDLFFDDILLIFLIFFLYQEGVEDDWLFIVLVLLLLG